MGWRTVIVNTHSKLTYKSNHLIFKDASRTEMIHLSRLTSCYWKQLILYYRQC